MERIEKARKNKEKEDWRNRVIVDTDYMKVR